MRLKIQNIGMIKNADIKLDGLTIIAGENDTGKSTVGKILFCLIKTINRYQEDFSESKEHKISEILEKLYFTIRRYAKIIDSELLASLKYLLSLDKYFYSKDNSLYIKELTSYVENLNLENEKKVEIISTLDSLNKIITEPDDEHKYIQSALNKVFHSEFDSDIIKNECQYGKIELYDGELLLLDISIEKNNKIILANNFQPIYFNDATFIETPLILNNHDLLIRSTTGLNATKATSRRLGIPYTTLHTKDLFDKLKEINFINTFLDDVNNNKITKEIISLINGELKYDSRDKKFKYVKNSIDIPIKNTATGIKSFGIIQLLVENEFINEKSFLILDEPEIHLHPKWQLEYAKLVSILIQNNIPILVTSHSPYMIEALQKYNNIKNINFYLTNNENIEQVNENNSDTLSAIFTKLSEPFETFDAMDSDKLQNG